MSNSATAMQVDSADQASALEPATAAIQAQTEAEATAVVQVASKINQSGIDIQRALDILADRSGCGDDHSKTHGCHHHATTGHNNQATNNATAEDLKAMGQTIDLFEKTDDDNNVHDTEAEKNARVEAAKKEQEEQRKERMENMKAKLKSMTVKELLQTVMETQQQRVEIYQGYNKSLATIVQSGNMTSYISSCAHATAAFAVLSETIIFIRSALADTNTHGRKDLEKLLTNLQSQEKEKLNLTAALHLERIRERNENMNTVNPAGSTDDRISKLLNQGVQSLTQKIDEVVGDINETLEELRYALLEEEDEE